MNGLIIYKSKYGAAKQYALWLAEETGFPAREAKSVGADELKSADILIAGSSVYIGKMLISDWLSQHAGLLSGKKLFLFMVSGAPPSEKEKLQQYLDASVGEKIRNQCKTYFFHGRMILKDLNWKDRLLLKIGSWATKDPSEKAGMLKEYDDVKKEYISEMVKDIKTGIVRQ